MKQTRLANLEEKAEKLRIEFEANSCDMSYAELVQLQTEREEQTRDSDEVKHMLNMVDFYNEFGHFVRYFNALDELESFQNTMSMELVHVETKYMAIPVGEKLVSPSGFHPDDNVFVKPTWHMMVDDTSDIPSTYRPCAIYTRK